jgi:hypothetical protein
VSPVYARLVELAEREAELIAAARYDELAALDDERSELVDGLPPVPPLEAGPFLERAAALQEQNTQALARALGDTRRGLFDVLRGRRAAGGYTPPHGAGGSLLDRRAS